MELESKSLLAVEAEQEGESISLNRSDMDLLTACQNEMEGTVIIYDNDTQEGQIVKIVANQESKTETESEKSIDDFSDLITLHASSESKNEPVEERDINETATLKVETSNVSEEPEVDSDDDETIATFMTSTGQQLALYAVEDSDEIFAVALYDESGAPPTNFHFLMKADVERLIGEGAVKTVKKPQLQQNKDAKPPENREEIKFERYQDVKPAVQKVDTPSPQMRKVEQGKTEIKTEMIEVPESKPQVGLSRPQVEASKSTFQMEVSKPKTQIEISKPRPQAQVSKPRPQIQLSKPSPQREISKHRTQIEVPKPKLQAEVSRPRQQMELSKPTPQVEISKPRVQMEVSKVRSPMQVSRPRQQIELAKPRPQMEVSKLRTQVEASKLKSYAEISKPRTQLEIPKSKVQAEILKIKPQIEIPAPKFQGDISKLKQQPVEIRKLQFLKSQDTKFQKVEQPKTIITKNTLGTKRIFAPIKQSTPKVVHKIISNASQPLMQTKKETSIAYVLTNEADSFITADLNEDFDSDAEIIEQSTVQYILCNEDVSDEELTFDELQASLQTFKMNTSANKSKSFEVEKSEKKKDSILRHSPKKPTHKLAPILNQKKEVTTTIYRTYKNPKKARMTNNLLQAHRKIKQEVEDPSYDFSSFDDGQFSSDEVPKEDKQALVPVKAKRSRKQQLTVVNRTDSEIIIQPASAFSEEEEEPVTVKKRGRRKKKLTPDPDYNPRRPARKKTRSNRSVEVINIDIEEGELAAAMASGKGKGSSDKENDVISVGDSEGDEEEEEDEEEAATGDEGPANKVKKQPLMQCTHCLRNFRKRRALERHLQACPKSPANIQKLEERKRQQASGKLPKRFKCKSCDETFDIAVALARHVRVTHSPRKRGRPAKNWSRNRDYDSSDTEVEEEEEEEEESFEESEPEPGPKRRGRPRVKRRSSREISPSQDFELKLDSSGEQLSGPRKRGRPPVKKNVASKEESPPPDSEEKSAAEQRRRTEPRMQIPKKRGRPAKRNLSKDEKTDTETEEKMESESRKRGRQSKSSVSKEESPAEKNLEASDTLEVKLVPVEIPKKRKLSKDQLADVDHERSSSEEKDAAPAKPIAEIPKKRRLSKEEPLPKDTVTETSKTETKVELSAEPPAKSESQSSEKEETPVAAESEKKVEPIEPAETEEKIEEATSEPRRSGRVPAKEKPSKEDAEASKEEVEVEAATQSPESKKRDKSKEKSSASPKPEEPTEASPESRKRGRPGKDLAKEKTPEPDETSESPSAESRKRGRPAKDRTAKDDSHEAESSVGSPEARKRSRTARSSPEAEAAEAQASPESDKDKVAKRKLPSPNRTWKVKKLNCADCGKWFSSAAALGTHRLQHRTKKSGHRLKRCRVCGKPVPADTYAKHQALAHGRTAASVAPELRRRGRARQVVAGAARRRRSLRSAN